MFVVLISVLLTIKKIKGMAEVEKIYMDKDGIGVGEMMALLQSNKGASPAELMAMMQNQGGLGGNNGLLWIFLLLLFNGGGGLFGNRAGAVAGQEAFDTNVLLRAIDGNAAAISQLSTSLNCDMNQINSALCAIKGGIDKVAGEIGFTGERVINAVQAGNCQLLNKLQECCCATQTAILNQTNVMQQGFTTLGNTVSRGFCDVAYAAQTNTRDIIDAGNRNTQAILDKLCQGEKAEMAREIGELRQKAQTAEIIAALSKSSGSVS